MNKMHRERAFSLNPDDQRTLSLTDQAYKAIRFRIITSQLESGADFTESDLARDLEMSKTPVREALLRLQMEGMVQTIPRRGYMVTPLRLSDINDIFDFRILIEGECAAQAARRAHEENLEEISGLAARSSDAADRKVGNDLDGIFHLALLNNAFHEAVAVAAFNDRLHRNVVQTLREYDRFYFLEWMSPIRYPADHMDHAAIVTQIVAGESEAARNAMVRHIEGARRTLVSALTEGHYDVDRQLSVI